MRKDESYVYGKKLDLEVIVSAEFQEIGIRCFDDNLVVVWEDYDSLPVDLLRERWTRRDLSLPQLTGEGWNVSRYVASRMISGFSSEEEIKKAKLDDYTVYPCITYGDRVIDLWDTADYGSYQSSMSYLTGSGLFSKGEFRYRYCNVMFKPDVLRFINGNYERKRLFVSRLGLDLSAYEMISVGDKRLCYPTVFNEDRVVNSSVAREEFKSIVRLSLQAIPSFHRERLAKYVTTWLKKTGSHPGYVDNAEVFIENRDTLTLLDVLITLAGDDNIMRCIEKSNKLLQKDWSDWL